MIPVPRWCPRCRRLTLTGRAEMYGRRIRACQACGHATKAREPKALKKAAKPLSWKRTAAKAAGDLDEYQWATIVAWFGGLCCYCERAPWTHMDHVLPISKGGKTTAANCVPACAPCNYRKGISTKWQPRRPHPFMARAQELAESFAAAPLKIGSE